MCGYEPTPIEAFVFALRDLIVEGRRSIGQEPPPRGAFGNLECPFCGLAVVVAYMEEAANGCVPYPACDHHMAISGLWLLAHRFADVKGVADRDSCATCGGTGLAA